MNHTIYADSDKNAIRFSNFKKLEVTCPFAGLGVKYVASGEEIYYANDKKYKVNAGEYIIGNEFTKSIVQIDHAKMVQGLCIDISSEIISEVAEFHDVNGSELKEFLLSDQFFVNRYNEKKLKTHLIEYSSSGFKVQDRKYEYDKYGNVIAEYSFGELASRYNYIYDSHGNWTELIENNSKNTLVLKITRIFNYYQ